MAIDKVALSRQAFLVGTGGIAALALLRCFGTGAGKTKSFYEGKKVELTIPFGPGGGTDTAARFIAPFLSKHIAGRPPVQVINRPGAVSILGTNQFAHAKRDGLTWFLSGSAIFSNVFLESPDIDYKLADFVPIIGFPVGSVVYASSKTGVTRGSELPRSKLPLILPVGGVGTSLLRMLGLDILGLKYKAITGYAGGSAERIAFLQGEVTIVGDSTPAYLQDVVPLVKEGEAVPVFNLGVSGPDGELIRDPGVPDIPHVGEVYKEIYGEAPKGEKWEAYKLLVNVFNSSGKIVWLHANDPKEAVEEVKAAALQLLEDPEYLKGVDQLLGGYRANTGKELEEQVKQIQQANPAILNWIRAYFKNNI